MKIRNHRRREWWYFPHESSSLNKGRCYIFKYKSDLMKFLNKNFEQSLNGTIRLQESSFGRSGCVREWFVWFNDYAERNSPLKIELRQQDFRGRKFVSKPDKISKSAKKYFAFSDKVISLMCNLEQPDGTILQKDAKRLVKLFYKRGFKDFEPNEEQIEYINGHINDGIQFDYWSDRCNWLRTKTIIEYFKRTQLI